MMKFTRRVFGLFLLLALPCQVAAGPLEKAVQETVRAHEEAQQSQERIDTLAEETRDLLQEYRSTLQAIDSLKSYNDQLEKQSAGQDEALRSIATQLNNLESTQRNIVPLMLRMIEVLGEFIALDMPFLAEERQARLEVIRSMMDRPDVSLPDKYRRIMEAYQIEMEYGRTIEAGTDTITLNGESSTVDTLRVGRVALLYQTLDGRESGYWDKREKRWKPLPGDYNPPIARGLLIARKQSPPDLFRIPVPAPEKVQ